MFRNHRKHSFRKDSTNYPSDYNEYTTVLDGRKNTNRVLDVSFNGLTNGATAATDASQSKHTISFNGTSVISTTQSYYNGGSSLYLNGSSSYVSIPDSDDWNVVTGNYTWKMKFFVSSLSSNNGIFSQITDSNNGIGCHILSRGAIDFVVRVGGTWVVDQTVESAIVINKWYDLIITRVGTAWNIYLDGSLIAVGSYSTSSLNFTSVMYIGYYALEGGQYFNGYIQDVIFVKGEAWNIHKFYNSTLDAKSSYLKAAWKFGAYSIYDCAGTNTLTNIGGVTFATAGLQGYNGATISSGKYLQHTSPDANIRSTIFTRNIWYNPSTNAPNSGTITANRPFFQLIKSGGGDYTINIYETNASGTLNLDFRIQQTDTNLISIAEPLTLTTGQWHMITATADGSYIRLYHNSTLLGSPAVYDGTLLDTTGGTHYIGSYDTRSQLDGIIAEATIYTIALSASEISLLYNQGKANLLKLQRRQHSYKFGNDYLDSYSKYLVAGWKLDEMIGTRYDSVGFNHLTDNGSVGYVTDGVFGRVASFNNNSLLTTYNSDLDFSGIVQFTISFWFYLADVTQFAGLYSGYDSVGTHRQIVIYIGSSKVVLDYNNETYYSAHPTTLSNNTWYHCVVTRDATNLNLYVNTVVGSVAHGSASWPANNRTAIGRFYENVDNYRPVGRMTNILAWKGVALDAAAITALYNAGAGLPLNYHSMIDNYNSSNQQLFPWPSKENA
jgi:hypothetical protein